MQAERCCTKRTCNRCASQSKNIGNDLSRAILLTKTRYVRAYYRATPILLYFANDTRLHRKFVSTLMFRCEHLYTQDERKRGNRSWKWRTSSKLAYKKHRANDLWLSEEVADKRSIYSSLVAKIKREENRIARLSRKQFAQCGIAKTRYLLKLPRTYPAAGT